MRNFLLAISLFLTTTVFAQTYVDVPFTQEYAVKFEFKDGAKSDLLQVRTDRNNYTSILTKDALYQPWKERIVRDYKYVPFESMNVIAVDIYKDQFVYLTDKVVLSNAWAGKFYTFHEVVNPTTFLVSDDFISVVAAKNEVAVIKPGKKVLKRSVKDFNPIKIVDDNNRYLILSDNGIFKLDKKRNKISKVFSKDGLTSMAMYNGHLVVGTKDGIFNVDLKTFKASELNQKLPYNEINTISVIDGNLWFGSTYGAFMLKDEGKYDYYASKRWLVDNNVIDIQKGPKGSINILSKTGLSQISYVEMTLAEKADYYQEILRKRFVRHGFITSTTLKVPGDVSSGVLDVTDNDGLWTSMYLATELFRYGATKSEDAKLNAYEAFEAMERLVDISGVKGFPARAFEREGVELDQGSNGFSEEQMIAWEKENGKTWQFDKTENWKWKVSTSSDESCGHFFVLALFAEIAPDKEWRDRAIKQIKLQTDHLIENDWHLVTWNGKPTRWGNWNPDYVNNFPVNVGDRRLNSTLILAFLQTAYHYVGDEIYKEKAFELIDKYGYDENANRPASVIGYVEGEDLSDGWNHSDDQMYFLTAPAFVNYSFNDEQRKKHFAAVKSHWEVERSEKNPLWNFLFALSGGDNIDLNESVWWLKEYPLDLVKWTMDNSKRQDLVRLEPNFRHQTFSEVLSPKETPVHYHNGAYRNSSKGEGRTEMSPYVWLMPYWAGRYIDAISAPVKYVD